MAVIDVTDSNFEQEVLKSDIPVVVDFWAAWCQPCKTLGAALEEFAAEHEGKIKIAKINVEQNPQLTTQFKVMNLPYFFMFKNGECIGQQANAPMKHTLIQWVKGFMD